MKLSTTIAGSVLLTGLLMTSASANDNAVPDLLEGVQPDQIVELSPEEASDVRGQRIRKKVGYRPGFCGWKPCIKPIYASVDFYYKDYKGRWFYVKH